MRARASYGLALRAFPDYRGGRGPYGRPMHASSMSEPGAFRIVIAIVLAAAVSVAAGAIFGLGAGFTVAAVAVLAGIAFETHHLLE